MHERTKTNCSTVVTRPPMVEMAVRDVDLQRFWGFQIPREHIISTATKTSIQTRVWTLHKPET